MTAFSTVGQEYKQGATREVLGRLKNSLKVVISYFFYFFISCIILDFRTCDENWRRTRMYASTEFKQIIGTEY